MTLGNEKILETERSTISQTVENSLWKKLWTWPKANCDDYFQEQRNCIHENYKQ